MVSGPNQPQPTSSSFGSLGSWWPKNEPSAATTNRERFAAQYNGVSLPSLGSKMKCSDASSNVGSGCSGASVSGAISPQGFQPLPMSRCGGGATCRSTISRPSSSTSSTLKPRTTFVRSPRTTLSATIQPLTSLSPAVLSSTSRSSFQTATGVSPGSRVATLRRLPPSRLQTISDASSSSSMAASSFVSYRRVQNRIRSSPRNSGGVVSAPVSATLLSALSAPTVNSAYVTFTGLPSLPSVRDTSRW